MKWNNKGHEYDAVYQNILSKNRFYLFGAGDYGKQFLKIFKDEINIVGYADNDTQKQNTIINGLKCIGVDDIPRQKNVGVVVTMSQIARVKPVDQLVMAGYHRNVDFFIIEEFISIYFVYRYNKVYFSSISFLPSTACNLNCRNCLNFNPFAKQFYVREWEDIKNDIDLFFSCVDHIMLFHVSGGEPMIYRYTADLIKYIDQNYGTKIDTLRTVTNGTIVPKDDVLKKLSSCNVEVTIDDYREAVPKYKDRFEQLVQKFEEYHIKYYVNKVDSWIDLAPEKTDYSSKNEDWMIQHRSSCSQSWQELRDGKLYSCNYAAYATVAGIAGEQNLEETFELKNFNPDRKKELIEFRLGYTDKGYTNFCKKCRGFTPDNLATVSPAVQVENEKNYV